MKSNTKLRQEIEKFKECIVIVEGKKDVLALEGLGFSRVYAIHSGGVSLRERIEQIASRVLEKEKVCVLTDFDKTGRQLYSSVKSVCQELGLRLDSTLRGIVIRSGISHIEGIDSFMNKAD